MGQNEEKEPLNTGRIALYGIALLILIAIPGFSHPLRVLLLSILSAFTAITLIKWHRDRPLEEDRVECQFTPEVRTMNCNRCGYVIGPSYMGVCADKPDGEELWKYICFNCGLRWDEYWHVQPQEGRIESKLGN